MSDETFAESVEGFFRAMRRARARWSAESKGRALSPSQFVLIVPLADGQPRPVRELAEGALVAAPTATRMLDTLQRNGLVERRPSETDRRCVLVELTDAGRDAVAEAKAHARARWRELAGRFDDDELEETERALRRLAAAIEAD